MPSWCRRATTGSTLMRLVRCHRTTGRALPLRLGMADRANKHWDKLLADAAAVRSGSGEQPADVLLPSHHHHPRRAMLLSPSPWTVSFVTGPCFTSMGRRL